MVFAENDCPAVVRVLQVLADFIVAQEAVGTRVLAFEGERFGGRSQSRVVRVFKLKGVTVEGNTEHSFFGLGSEFEEIRQGEVDIVVGLDACFFRPKK